MIDREQMRMLAAGMGIDLDAGQLAAFDSYAQFLVEYNEKVNLTAITDPAEICEKHFLDSLLLLKAVDLPKGGSLVDVGTGAGFPAVPVKIVRPDLAVTLLDGLNKRIVFLEQLSAKLGQENRTIHARAEEAGRGELREIYDCATARAVADLRVLSEYCLPLVKVGGVFAALKGPTGKDEARAAGKGIELLGGRVEAIREYSLPDGSRREIVVVRKVKAGNFMDALWEEITWWIVFAGIGLMVLGVTPLVLYAGLALVVAGPLVTGKGFGKITGIFGSLYNHVTGYFGDILSYSRLMALMLAGSVIAQVFNTLGAIPGNIVIFLIISAAGNALNFALNLLGCYVHDLRLQCLEYFGKFYEDGGKPFRPLDLSAKYYDVVK